MNSRLFALAFSAAALAGPLAAAQTVDGLVADPKALNAELDRCKSLGLASEHDARCKIANQAEDRRFIGKGATYTPLPIDLFPNSPDHLVPAEKTKKPTHPTGAKRDGQ